MAIKPYQSHIEHYFDFSNPNWKKRHILFLIVDVFNLAIIIAFLVLNPLTNIWKITTVSAFIGIFIITIILFIYKRAWYHYLNYIFVIFGMVCAILVTFLMDFPPEGIIFERLLLGLLIISAIFDLVFLLNYVSIEYSQRKAKPRNLKEYGTFISVKRNL